MYEKTINNHRYHYLTDIGRLLHRSWLLPRTDVVVADFEVSEQEDEMTIYTYILSSAGYSRTVKNVSDDPEKMMLKFYSAFGGVNGSIGAKSEFDLPLAPECKEIYVLLYDDYRLTLAKNPLLENGNESNNRLLEKIIS